MCIIACLIYIMHTGTSKYLSAKVPDGTSNLKSAVEYCMKGMRLLYQMHAFIHGGGEDKRYIKAAH